MARVRARARGRRSSVVSRRIARVGLGSVGCLLILTVMSAPAWAQAAPDPQSLVGDWTGSWVDERRGKSTGQYSLMIERVVGATVHGHGEIADEGAGVRKFKFVGALEGNRLTFGRDVKTDLTIDGTQMRGTYRGPHAFRNITVSKHK